MQVPGFSLVPAHPSPRQTLTWKNGDRFEGTFADGLRTGQGRLRLRNGQVHEGSVTETVSLAAADTGTAAAPPYPAPEGKAEAEAEAAAPPPAAAE